VNRYPCVCSGGGGHGPSLKGEQPLVDAVAIDAGYLAVVGL
jgi:hypothetical protein